MHPIASFLVATLLGITGPSMQNPVYLKRTDYGNMHLLMPLGWNGMLVASSSEIYKMFSPFTPTDQLAAISGMHVAMDNNRSSYATLSGAVLTLKANEPNIAILSTTAGVRLGNLTGYDIIFNDHLCRDTDTDICTGPTIRHWWRFATGRHFYYVVGLNGPPAFFRAEKNLFAQILASVGIQDR